MPSDNSHNWNEKDRWDRLRQRAGFETSSTASDHKEDHKGLWRNARDTHEPVKDHLYDLIEAPERDSGKHELFGMAKTFPETTRRGYREYLHKYLSHKSDPDQSGDEPLSEEEYEKGHSRHHNVLELKDFSIFYRLRIRVHAELAEFFGMFVFLAIGYASSCQAVVSAQSGNALAVPVTLSWGFAQMIGIYVAGGYSGAHLNPVLTLNLWFFRGFPFSRMFSFWVAQFFGALAASAWIFILYYPALKKLDPNGWSIQTSSAFLTEPAEGMPIASAWFNEVTNTALIHIIVFAVGDSHNISPARGMNALVIGFAVTALGSAFGYLSPFGMNPVRDFAPRIFLSMVGFPKQIWTRKKWWWITGEFTGPLLGGILGSLAYDVLIFDGPESPINFPKGIKRRTFKAFIDDLMHPFSKRQRSRHQPGLDVDESRGTVQLQGQPAN